MANVKGLITKQQQNQEVAQPQQTANTLQALISTKSVAERFEKMLGENSASFLSSVLTTVNDSKLLRNADPRTVLASAAIAASLKLPVVSSLGKAYLVPYKGACALQIGYKGLIALAQRSGQMKFITAFPVYEGECKSWDKFTETMERGEKISDKIVGYYAAFQLLNGFTKASYWTDEEITAHAKKFSKNYSSPASVWATSREQMACKTVLASILRTYAPMSVEMQDAFVKDGKIHQMDINGTIEDTGDVFDAEVVTEDGHTVDVETGEIIFSADDVEEAVQG